MRIIPKPLAAQGFRSHTGVLAAEGKAVGNHGDEFTIAFEEIFSKNDKIAPIMNQNCNFIGWFIAFCSGDLLWVRL